MLFFPILIRSEIYTSLAQEAKLYQNHLEYYKIFMNSHDPGFFAGL